MTEGRAILPHDRERNKRMKIQPIFAWYDLWIGLYWDRTKRRLYILPLPCIGLYVQFKEDKSI